MHKFHQLDVQHRLQVSVSACEKNIIVSPKDRPHFNHFYSLAPMHNKLKALLMTLNTTGCDLCLVKSFFEPVLSLDNFFVI